MILSPSKGDGLEQEFEHRSVWFQIQVFSLYHIAFILLLRVVWQESKHSGSPGCAGHLSSLSVSLSPSELSILYYGYSMKMYYVCRTFDFLVPLPLVLMPFSHLFGLFLRKKKKA